MPKADILQLADDLSLEQADQSVLSALHDDLMLDLARAEAWLTDVSVIQSQNGVSVYTPQKEVIRLLGLFYDSDHLSIVDEQELEQHRELWRDVEGRPITVNVDDQVGKSFELFPVPDVDGAPLPGGLGEILFAEVVLGGTVILGDTFSEGMISMIHTARRTDFLPYMEWPIAFLLLQREYLRESDHRDEDFAAACGLLGRTFMEMIRDGRDVS